MLLLWLCISSTHRENNRKGKERKSIYIAVFGQGGTLKVLRHGSHILPANNTMPAFPSWAFTRCHHHSNWGSGHPSASHYSFIDPERMKGWAGLVGWPIRGWFTHISGHPSATARAQDSESKPAKDRCSTAGLRNQLWVIILWTVAVQYLSFILHCVSKTVMGGS